MGSISQELRQAILQSAIQGKLTKQLPKDGNARDLLKQIKDEKDRLIKEKKIPVKKQTIPFYEDDELEELNIPNNWIFVPLSDVSLIQEGAGIRKWQYRETGIQLLCVTNILDGAVDLEKKNLYVSIEEYIEKYKHLTLNIGDIVCACSGGSWGKSAVYDKKDIVMLNTSTLRLRFFGDIADNLYLYYLTKSEWFKKQLRDQLSGMQPNFGYAHYSRIVIPLPPLAEQHRIVARVEELMAKIDELEKVENELRALHKAFPDDMKSALLQSAMQGKLTEQLPEDGDAKLLLKEALNSRKSIGKLPQTNVIDDVGLPDNWSYASVGNIFGLLKGNNISGKKLPYLEAKYLRGNIEATIKDNGEFVVKGTRVILVDGENSGEIFIEPEDGYLGSTFKVLYIPECLNKKFACYFLDMNKTLLRQKKKGAAIPHLNKEIFYNLVFPVPPLAEQKRIVEKLDKLLPLCDSLKTELY